MPLGLSFGGGEEFGRLQGPQENQEAAPCSHNKLSTACRRVRTCSAFRVIR